MMNRLCRSKLQGRKKALLWVFLAYAFLLLLSYGFPATGDDWYFYPKLGTSLPIGQQFSRAVQISAHHYETTNGRLLGNFLVSFFAEKVLRELVRCGIVLLILLFLYRLSENRGLSAFLMCFAFLIAMPASVVSQTYTWAAGFFNYVPPVMFILIYFDYAKRIFCDGLQRRSVGWMLLLFLLGLSTQFFIENASVGMCVVSLTFFAAGWIHNKRMDPTLAAHLLGVAIGCAVMFLAPGYKNVGVENYRTAPSDFAELLQVAESNFLQLSKYLITDNDLVVLPLCICGFFVCQRDLSGTNGKRLLSKACLLYFLAFPVVSYEIHSFEKYYFVIEFLLDLGLFAALIMTAITCVRDTGARFVLLTAAGTFLVFVAPLLVVSPVGPRNAYLFDVLLILITMTLFRQATRDWEGIKRIAPAMALVSCFLLFGNLLIHYNNGKVERLRDQIAAEAIEQGKHEITLPGYPFPTYIHGSESVNAMSDYYYIESPGDITFQFKTYRQWLEDQ